MTHTDILTTAEELAKSSDEEAKFYATQLALNYLPPSQFVERYLEDNEGRPQNLEGFPMLRAIYDTKPKRLLLKCSRKTLKSTLLSNITCNNMLRWNKYAMMYVGPQELSVKTYSQNYIEPRFESYRLKRLINCRWKKNDVFEKRLKMTGSSCIFRYVKDDATRIRGPAVDEIHFDEIQDILAETLPIIYETMALSEYKRSLYSGTPLTLDNTINVLWERSSMCEWYTKCVGCNHWNSLTLDNDPLKMILQHGFSCSKCSKIIDTRKGEWVSMNPAKLDQFVGYHLAQPLLPHFNQNPKEWMEFYLKVVEGDKQLYQIYNEYFGIAIDIGSKPITKEELIATCKLGSMKAEPHNNYPIHNTHKSKYTHFSLGADWGVSGISSRTAYCLLGMTTTGEIHCISARSYNDFNYDGQIREIARVANDMSAKCVCDSGPDPDRGIRLIRLTAPERTCLAVYCGGALKQHWIEPEGAISYEQSRWALHRSDTLGLVFKYLKSGKLLFPCWDEMSYLMQDILNEFIEVKKGTYGDVIMYRHDPKKPDDFLHAVNYALCGLLAQTGDKLLEGPSSDSGDFIF